MQRPGQTSGLDPVLLSRCWHRPLSVIQEPFGMHSVLSIENAMHSYNPEAIS